MKLKNFKKNKIIKTLTSVFVLIFIAFAVWMLFFDENSYLVHRELDKEIKGLENSITFYEYKISQDKASIKKLQDSLQLERFAREKYLMKKKTKISIL